MFCLGKQIASGWPDLTRGCIFAVNYRRTDFDPSPRRAPALSPSPPSSEDNWQLSAVRPPQNSWIAPSAIVIGRVRLAEHCIVLPTAVIRGDTEEIHIGEGSNVQDGCILHADPQFPCRIGRRCSLGHRAIIHGATVEDDCLIGIGAIVLNGAVIGQGSLIAAGTLIPEGKQIPPGSVVMGVPGKVVRQTTEADQARIRHAAEHYRNSIAAYQKASDE